MIFEYKVWPKPFEEIVLGAKDYDVRGADFEALPGDVVKLREWDPDIGDYTGRERIALIIHQFRTDHAPPAYRLPAGVVVSRYKFLRGIQ